MKNYLPLLFVCLLTTSCVDKIERPMASGSQPEPDTEVPKVIAYDPLKG